MTYTGNERTGAIGLHVEYVERGYEYGVLFMSSLFCEYIHLEYICVHGIHRVNQAEYGIHVLVVAPQEYVNIYSTRRVIGLYKRILSFKALVHERILPFLPLPI